MNDKIEIQRPVEIKENSKERVALDLMERIARIDDRFETEQNDRKYWLTLYYQCLKATSGTSLKLILREE